MKTAVEYWEELSWNLCDCGNPDLTYEDFEKTLAERDKEIIGLIDGIDIEIPIENEGNLEYIAGVEMAQEKFRAELKEQIERSK